MFADLQGGVKTRGAKADVEPVTLEETSKEIILLINHVYAGPHYQVTPSDMFSGLWLAKKYDMPRLGEACRAYLDGVHLVEHNTPGWLAVAPGYEVARFTKRCVEYAAGALQSIIDYRYFCSKSRSCSVPCTCGFGLRCGRLAKAKHRARKELPTVALHAGWGSSCRPRTGWRSCHQACWWRSCSCARARWAAWLPPWTSRTSCCPTRI